MMDKKIIESPKTKKKYILTKLLGRGSFGFVYFSDPYAVKIVNLAHADPKIIQMLRNQAKLLSEIKNKNVVSLIEYFEIEKQLYLVMEYCQTDLQKYLKNNEGLSEQKILCIFKQILSGYKEVYIKKIIHRDIKPANILVRNNNQFKLADFGLARYVVHDQLLKTNVGTPLFSSPQLLNSQEYTIKNDIWSLGVLLYFMIFKKAPWQAHNIIVLIQKIESGLPPLVSDQVSDSTKILLTKMLTIEEQNRIQWIQLFQKFNISVPSEKSEKKDQNHRNCKSTQKNEQKKREENSLMKRNENLKINQSYSSNQNSQKIKRNNQRSVSLHPNPRLKHLGEEDNSKSQKNKSQAGENEGESKIKIVSLLIQGAKKFRNFLSSTSNKDTWTSEQIKQLIQAEGSIYCGELIATKVFTKKYKQMSPGQRDDFQKILHNFNANFQKAAKLVYQLNDQ